MIIDISDILSCENKEETKQVQIGTRLAASVITSSENVCPRFLPAELGIDA